MTTSVKKHNVSCSLILAASATLLFSACANSPRQNSSLTAKNPAITQPAIATTPPLQVRELPMVVADTRPLTHTVKKGDTLYSIALEYGHDYKEIALWNNLESPFIIKIGQVLTVASPSGNVPKVMAKALPKPGSDVPVVPTPIKNDPLLKTYPKGLKLRYSDQALVQIDKESVAPQPTKSDATLIKPTTTENKAPEKTAGVSSEDDVDWSWPVTGKMVGTFQENSSLKGIDIAGKSGQPVYASAPGKVVYSGAGLRGYGKLIIIKHNKTFLSAYAHNSQILVKEGQNVVKGQKIAEMGSTDADQVKLHFEIRRMGKPVDPLRYLPPSG